MQVESECKKEKTGGMPDRSLASHVPSGPTGCTEESGSFYAPVDSTKPGRHAVGNTHGTLVRELTLRSRTALSATVDLKRQMPPPLLLLPDKKKNNENRILPRLRRMLESFINLVLVVVVDYAMQRVLVSNIVKIIFLIRELYVRTTFKINTLTPFIP